MNVDHCTRGTHEVCLFGRHTKSRMEGKHQLNNKESNSPDVTQGRGVSTIPTQWNGQLSFGRRILATKKELRIRTKISCMARGEQKMRQQNCEVSLKDRSGLVVEKGILLSEIQTGEDVGGLSLFPHQVAVRIVEVFTCGNENETEDGQVLKTCVGEIVTWSRSAVHAIDNVLEGTTPSIPTEQEFDFNDDMCNPNMNNDFHQNRVS